MTEIDELFDRINRKTEEIFVRIPEEYEKTIDWLNNYKVELISKVKLVQSGNYNVPVPVLPKTPSRNRRAKRAAELSSSEEESNTTNSVNQSSDITDSSISSKPKRNASKIAQQKINVQSHLNLRVKMRRPGNTTDGDIFITTIKKEKDSPEKEKQSLVPQVNIKSEPTDVKSENMPPPVAIPKRRKKIKNEVESSDTENESKRVTRSKKGVKSSTSSQPKRNTKSSKNRKDSDVILQEVPVPVVVINDSDPDETNKQTELEIQNNNKNTKKDQELTEDSDEDVPIIHQKNKNKKSKDEAKTKKIALKTKIVETAEVQEESLYEDALPTINNKDEEVTSTNDKTNDPLKLKECFVTLENIMLNKEENLKRNTEDTSLNTTHVIEKSSNNLNDTHIISKKSDTKVTNTMNCTVVLQKLNDTVSTTNNGISNQTIVLTPKENHLWKKAEIPLSSDNILTEDEDSIVKATPEKFPDPPRKGIKKKQMFSPYANSPVRKRVAAFEKLVANDESEVPTRTTRTKTRNMEKEKENMLQNNTEVSSVKSSAKSKYCTPLGNHKLPSLIPQSDTKAYRQGTMGSKTSSSILSTKSASAMKPTRAELQVRREEEQKKRLEKEEEAKKKREAIMLAKAEEQRKKREEKQMKAQKAREELEREKEEKLRQMIQEKEEEQQKKREWQAKKLAEIEERKKAEAIQLKLKLREQEKLMKQLEEEKRKKKLASKPPPLPTDDCEDSDSSSESNSRKPVYQKPLWAQSMNLCKESMNQRCLPKNLIEAFFSMEATTPDLLEIFETIDERMLRRNSSAVWRTPPRYSTLPKF